MTRRRAWAVRIGGSLALVGFGVLAAASGIDRMSLYAPALGRLVPGPLQAQAARSTAALAITRGQSEAAIAAARKAVAADPVDPASTGSAATALRAAAIAASDWPRVIARAAVDLAA